MRALIYFRMDCQSWLFNAYVMVTSPIEGLERTFVYRFQCFCANIAPQFVCIHRPHHPNSRITLCEPEVLLRRKRIEMWLL